MLKTSGNEDDGENRNKLFAGTGCGLIHLLDSVLVNIIVVNFNWFSSIGGFMLKYCRRFGDKACRKSCYFLLPIYIQQPRTRFEVATLLALTGAMVKFKQVFNITIL